jgi:hypothetical protein
MAALNPTDLKPHRTSIGKAAHCWKASLKRARGDPRIIAARRRRKLLHGRCLATAKPHRPQNRGGSISDQRSKGGVEAVRTATH